MTSERVSFTGPIGKLAGSIELPAFEPRAYALFAHCFTCGKDSIAATRVARALALDGIAVLRFDFAGLGASEGDFAETGFGANIDDVLAAADFLRREHGAPELLIGHSLGGTAVLAAAARITEAAAVVTINAPASPDHVLRRFGDAVERIERDGEAEVTLAGRPFRIQKSFLDDLKSMSLHDSIHGLGKALLVMHSPVDTVVGISEAASIFEAALHPKSFLSLDDADHLLRDPRDAEYAARMITSWASRYLGPPDAVAAISVESGHVHVGEANRRFLCRVASDDHTWLADEPNDAGGDNLGPDPYEHLLAALGTCTSMTLRMYANRKGWPLDAVEVELDHRREHRDDCENCEDPNRLIDVIHRKLSITGELTREQYARLLEIADRCPVHKTLKSDIRIETEAPQ